MHVSFPGGIVSELYEIGQTIVWVNISLLHFNVWNENQGFELL